MKLLRCRWRQPMAVLMTVAGISCAGLTAETADAPRNIVLLYAGDLLVPAAVVQDHALREAITSGTTNSVNFFIETLHQQDLSRSDFDEAFISFVRRKYQDQQIHLVIVAGTAALHLLERHRAELWPTTPIMFFSVDETFAPARKSSDRITGLTIKFDAPGTMDFATRLQPNAHKVVVIAGVSEFDRSWLPGVQSYLQSRRPELAATYLTNHTIAQLLDEVRKVPADSIVLLTTIVQDAAGKSYTGRDAAARLSAASKAPVYSLYETMLGNGIVGGVMPSLEMHGRRAGELALRLLGGEKPDDISVGPAAPAVPMVDFRQLRRFRISESRLPAGTTISFRQPTLWESHRDYVLVGFVIFVAQAVTIGALMAQLARRRRAETATEESEERMALAADAANLGMWVWDIPGNRFWASERCKQIFGYPVEANVTFEMMRARVHPEDLAKRDQSIERAVATGGRYDLQYRLLFPDGTVRWLAVAARADRDAKGNATQLLGASIDITDRHNAEASARELGGRLINAQEDERRRIARDLHDDLNQRLALLSVEMEMLQRAENGKGQGAAPLERMGAQVKDISSDVHKLAYQLHPAKLDQLGLVAAARGLCRDLSRQAAMEIRFAAEAVPEGIPPQLALCAYRVLQESLGNVVRHSGAKTARVELRGNGDELLLAVSDEGKGFDVEAAREVSGLGLVSMNERARLINGKFEIKAAPGQGTRIELSLPLPAAVQGVEDRKLEVERCT